MKKLLPSILALAMLVTVMMSFSVVASANANITTTIVECNDADDLDDFNNSQPDAYIESFADLKNSKVYKVTTTISDIGLNYVAKKGKSEWATDSTCENALGALTAINYTFTDDVNIAYTDKDSDGYDAVTAAKKFNPLQTFEQVTSKQISVYTMANDINSSPCMLVLDNSEGSRNEIKTITSLTSVIYIVAEPSTNLDAKVSFQTSIYPVTDGALEKLDTAPKYNDTIGNVVYSSSSVKNDVNATYEHTADTSKKLVWVASALNGTSVNKKIVISDGNETVTQGTLAEEIEKQCNGVVADGAKITGSLPIGIVTAKDAATLSVSFAD